MRRSASYFLFVSVIFAVTYLLMVLTSTTRVEPDQLWQFFMSNNGMIVLLFAVVISLAYPLFGFAKKSVTVRDISDLSAVDRVMEASGYVLTQDNGAIRRYRPVKALARLRMLYNDTVTIDASRNPIEISGTRTVVIVLVMRLENEQ
ncbi:MAG: hypothetical protein K2N21_07670 [Rikenellaceae bacterium]|nr:hypothetical protein [Rikenellaceae bacterium]